MSGEYVTIRFDVHPGFACACGDCIVYGFDGDWVGCGIWNGQIPAQGEAEGTGGILQFEHFVKQAAIVCAEGDVLHIKIGNFLQDVFGFLDVFFIEGEMYSEEKILGNDDLDGGEGIDDVQGREGDDFLAGGAGNDFLYGDGNDPTVLSLVGGNDSLDGEEGDDLLWGGAGQDQ